MSLKQVLEQWQGRELKQLLIELYIDQDLSMADVAKELSISVGIVHKWLNEYGISKQKGLWDIKD